MHPPSDLFCSFDLLLDSFYSCHLLTCLKYFVFLIRSTYSLEANLELLMRRRHLLILDMRMRQKQFNKSRQQVQVQGVDYCSGVKFFEVTWNVETYNATTHHFS